MMDAFSFVISTEKIIRGRFWETASDISNAAASKRAVGSQPTCSCSCGCAVFVYHGAQPDRPVAKPPDTVAMAAVRSRVQEFHRLTYAAQADAAWALVWQREPTQFEKFKEEVGDDDGRRLVSWSIKDIIIYDLPVNLRSDFDGANRFAIVAVQISLVGSPVRLQVSREMTQYWLEINDQWRVSWNGFYS